MRESHTSYRDAGTSSWLNSKVQRRQTRDCILKEGSESRQEKAERAAESFLEDLGRKAELRDEIRLRMEESKKAGEELVRQKAEAYRQRLRGYLRPELREE